MKRYWSLFSHLVLVYVVVFLLSIFLTIGILVYSFRNFYISQLRQELFNQAYFFEDHLRQHLYPNKDLELQRFIQELGKKTHRRITVIANDGTVVADSEKDFEKMDNHADRPEIIQAKNEGHGFSIRYSQTMGIEMLYVAIPLIISGVPHYYLRISVPIHAIHATSREIYAQGIWIGAVTVLIVLMISMYLTRRIIHPIEELKQGAARYASGTADYPIALTQGPHEFWELAYYLNIMGEELHRRIEMISHQHEQLQAILGSMAEGVIAITPHKKILNINQAACHILNCRKESCEAESIDSLGHQEIIDIINEALTQNQRLEKEIWIKIREVEQYLQILISPIVLPSKQLRSGQNYENRGIVVVLNDITRLKHLEQVRQDFVANVSHELKTPITAIIGFSETLLTETKEELPPDALHFLGIIKRQADRLHSIINDLLLLARLEHLESPGNSLERKSECCLTMIQNALEICEKKAMEKNIRVEVDCDPELRFECNAHLLEQALSNLVDNAIKYSNPQSTVWIHAFVQDHPHPCVRIVVKDQGIGIPQDKIPRLFERFYRVDKARSREMGGTGLGLAIVKHIVTLHNGQMVVQSELGKGSEFAIVLPFAR